MQPVRGTYNPQIYDVPRNEAPRPIQNPQHISYNTEYHNDPNRYSLRANESEMVETARPHYERLHPKRVRDDRLEASIDEPKVKAKGCCGFPCWALLGFLGLLGVVLGMLFGLGVLGGIPATPSTPSFPIKDFDTYVDGAGYYDNTITIETQTLTGKQKTDYRIPHSVITETKSEIINSNPSINYNQSPASVNPTSVNPTAIAPTSVAPISVAPQSVNPVGVEPVSVHPFSRTPQSMQPVSVSPISVSPS